MYSYKCFPFLLPEIKDFHWECVDNYKFKLNKLNSNLFVHESTAWVIIKWTCFNKFMSTEPWPFKDMWHATSLQTRDVLFQSRFASTDLLWKASRQNAITNSDNLHDLNEQMYEKSTWCLLSTHTVYTYRKHHLVVNYEALWYSILNPYWLETRSSRMFYIILNIFDFIVS